MNDGLENLNQSELLQILANSGHGNLRLKVTTPRERLIDLIRSDGIPHKREISGTARTRLELQEWIETNWDRIGSQLPCTGPTRGMCTVYPCSEGRHIECYLSAQKHIV